MEPSKDPTSVRKAVIKLQPLQRLIQRREFFLITLQTDCEILQELGLCMICLFRGQVTVPIPVCHNVDEGAASTDGCLPGGEVHCSPFVRDAEDRQEVEDVGD